MVLDDLSPLLQKGTETEGDVVGDGNLPRLEGSVARNFQLTTTEGNFDGTYVRSRKLSSLNQKEPSWCEQVGSVVTPPGKSSSTSNMVGEPHHLEGPP